MIQRIQTLFLLAALVFTGLLFFVPFASLTPDVIYSVSFSGITSPKVAEQIQQPYQLTVLGWVTTILIFITIFLFRNRKLQMRLTLLCILFSLGLLTGMYFLSGKYESILATGVKYHVSFVFPLVAIILLYLAYRSIRKDENLIKSLDRLR